MSSEVVIFLLGALLEYARGSYFSNAYLSFLVQQGLIDKVIKAAVELRRLKKWTTVIFFSFPRLSLGGIVSERVRDKLLVWITLV